MREGIRILAIDPGSRHLGYAPMIDESILLSGVLDLPGNCPETWTTLHYWSRFHIDGIKLDSGYVHKPEVLILESYFPQRQRGATIIPELRGVIKLAAYQAGIDVVEVPPGTVKKCVTGYGRSTKDEVRKAINDRYGLSIKSEDQCDAVATGLAGLQRLREADDVEDE